MPIKIHFPNASLIEKIGEDRIDFEIYRILLPDEDDEEFEREYFVIYEPKKDKVVFSGAVVRSSEPVILPDYTRTYLYEKLKELVRKLKSVVRSKKAREKLDALLDLDRTFSIAFSKDRTYIRQNTPSVEMILTTTSEEAKDLIEQIFTIREILKC